MRLRKRNANDRYNGYCLYGEYARLELWMTPWITVKSSRHLSRDSYFLGKCYPRPSQNIANSWKASRSVHRETRLRIVFSTWFMKRICTTPRFSWWWTRFVCAVPNVFWFWGGKHDLTGMGDLNFIIGLHLALFTALFIHGGQKDSLLLCAGGWKMLIAYWGIWNHRQVSACN